METVIVTSKELLKQIVKETVREELVEIIREQQLVKTSSEDVLLTRAEMSKFLHISLVTLGDWVRRGMPVHRKRKRGRVLFIKGEVVDWLKQNPELKSNRR